MGFVIIVTPFWSAITEAYTKNEFGWIKKSVKHLVRIWFLSITVLLVMLLVSNQIYYLWIGNTVYIPFILSVAWVVFIAVQSLNSIFVHFINGVGKIHLQLYLSGISAIINIPLAIYLAKYLEFGVVGVIASTIITQIMMLFAFYIQYRKIINNNAVGIWAK